MHGLKTKKRQYSYNATLLGYVYAKRIGHFSSGLHVILSEQTSQ